MSKQICDECGEKQTCQKFTRKELRTEGIKIPMASDKKFKGWVYPQFENLKEKHGFERKSRFCKHCLDTKFPLLILR